MEMLPRQKGNPGTETLKITNLITLTQSVTFAQTNNPTDKSALIKHPTSPWPSCAPSDVCPSCFCGVTSTSPSFLVIEIKQRR